ncbi:Dabb family protein [bacterium]|jgi:hypothetical protein|nr:Dabb family protein [bacterium]
MGMVRHFVMCQFREGTSQETIDDLMKKIHGMKGQIPGIIDIESGPHDSPEGMNQGYTHGFLVTFESPEARDAYLPHPKHEAVRQALIPNIESACAFDYEVK